MPRFKFQVKDRRTPQGFWEEYNENMVTNQAEAEALAKRWVEEFNRTEVSRYGEKAAVRELIAVEYLGDGPRQHEYEKSNSMTIGGDGHGNRDRWICKVCGCVGLRYGLSQTIKRTGKWAAKKYQYCHGAEA